MTPLAIAAGIDVLAWAWLLAFRGGFWRTRERLTASPAPAHWPDVVAVIPARDEADVVARTIGAVAAQDYPGRLTIVLVDDQSEDGTADVARAAVPDTDRLVLLRAAPRPDGWAPKVWAMSQGHARAAEVAPAAQFVWLTDADVEHAPDTLRNLVAKAEHDSLDQVSLMVELAIESAWERLLIPAFVLFFQKLYPFAWANDRSRSTAAAAGGCILLARDALDRAGGFATIHDALIDDCSLARAIKPVASARGRGTWLGLTESSKSIRGYGGLRGVWKMVARSAYTQLGYSPGKLLGTVAGMLLLYLLPPLLLLAWPLHRDTLAAALGASAWTLMAVSMLPILRFYRQPRLLAAALPLAGLLYTAMTIDSALAHARGRGSAWKGRRLLRGD